MTIGELMQKIKEAESLQKEIISAPLLAIESPRVIQLQHRLDDILSETLTVEPHDCLVGESCQVTAAGYHCGKCGVVIDEFKMHFAEER